MYERVRFTTYVKVLPEFNTSVLCIQKVVNEMTDVNYGNAR